MNRPTHCIRGHEYTPENSSVKIRYGREHRTCKECVKFRLRGKGEVYRPPFDPDGRVSAWAEYVRGQLIAVQDAIVDEFNQQGEA